MNEPGGGTVGRFRVVSRLGPDVLLGEDDAGRQAAVRLLPAAADPQRRERLRDDVQAAAGAPPWFAAAVLDADPDAEPPWIATAHTPGPTLTAYIGEHGPLNDDGVFALATRMLDGLVALHEARITHRNLTPDTVVLAADGPRVTDTGITGLPGVPGFRAPEADHPSAGPPADMYSLGALLRYAATGRTPQSVAGEPDLDPLTGRIRDGVLGCLQVDWAGRPTAAQLRDYLRAGIAAAEPVTARVPQPDPADERTAAYGVAGRAAVSGTGPIPPQPDWAVRPAARRFPAVAIAAVVLVVAALVAGGVLLVGRGGSGTGSGQVAAAPTAASPAGPTDPFTPAGPTATPAPSSGSVTDPAAGAVVTDAAADPRFTASAARFVSPSRNIACTLTAEQARCDVLERTWTTPAPAGCTSPPTGAVLSGDRATLTCGPTAAPTATVLDYETGVRLGDVVCVSRESGMQCLSSTGRGFRVSRGSYDLY